VSLCHDDPLQTPHFMINLNVNVMETSNYAPITFGSNISMFELHQSVSYAYKIDIQRFIGHDLLLSARNRGLGVRTRYYLLWCIIPITTSAKGKEYST